VKTPESESTVLSFDTTEPAFLSGPGSIELRLETFLDDNFSIDRSEIE
jgi:hypothetical protein